MAETKFTEGPWETDGADDAMVLGVSCATVGTATQTIAYVPSRLTWKDQDLPFSANAHLIAEAPDMYQLLERAKDLFEMDEECGKPGTDAWAWLQHTEITLARARGEQK